MISVSCGEYGDIDDGDGSEHQILPFAASKHFLLSWISFALTMTKTNIMVTMMMVLMNATGDADSAPKIILTAAFLGQNDNSDDHCNT